MITTDDELRQAYRSHRQEAQADGHPDSEQLWRLAAGELTAAESREVIYHISSCPACAEDFRLTRELVAEASADAESAGQRATPDIAAVESADAAATDRSVVAFPRRADSGGRWLRNFAAAAALALVAGGFGWRLAQPDDPTFRQGGESQIRSLIADGVIVPRDNARLRWEGPDGAVYDLIVTTEALRVITEVEGLMATEFLVPEVELRELPPGTVLRWHVEGALPDGRRFPSETFDLQLEDD